MNIVYAAENASIASLLAEHLQRDINPRELRVSEDPEEKQR